MFAPRPARSAGEPYHQFRDGDLVLWQEYQILTHTDRLGKDLSDVSAIHTGFTSCTAIQTDTHGNDLRGVPNAFSSNRHLVY